MDGEMCQMNKLWICGEVGDAALSENERGRVGSPRPMSGVPIQSEGFGDDGRDGGAMCSFCPQCANEAWLQVYTRLKIR